MDYKSLFAQKNISFLWSLANIWGIWLILWWISLLFSGHLSMLNLNCVHWTSGGRKTNHHNRQSVFCDLLKMKFMVHEEIRKKFQVHPQQFTWNTVSKVMISLLPLPQYFTSRCPHRTSFTRFSPKKLLINCFERSQLKCEFTAAANCRYEFVVCEVLNDIN